MTPPAVSPAQTMAMQAMEAVRTVQARLDGHERLCEERSVNIQRGMDGLNSRMAEHQKASADDRLALKTSVGKVHERIDEIFKWQRGMLFSLAGAVIVAFLGVILKATGLA